MEFHYIKTIASKLAAKESIDEHHLNDNVDEVEHFAEKVSKCIRIVSSSILVQVVDQSVFAGILLIGAQNDFVEVVDDLLHTALLPNLPQKVWHVEAKCLKEQHDTNL